MPAKKHTSSSKHVSTVDPIVLKVQETLEENLTYFIDNIAGLVRRYDGLLGRALQLNKGTASEIAQLQTFMTNKNDDDASTQEDGAAPAATKSSGAAAGASGEKQQDSSAPAEGSTSVHPLVRQVSASSQNLPTSPLLKRAASPIVGGQANASAGDAFPSIDAAAKKETTTTTTTTTKKGGAKEGAASPTSASASAKKKIRIVEVKFPDNTEIVKQLRMLKRESYELGATMDGIHDWIALNVPDMKDDDNDGVEVMGAVIEQVSSLTDTVRSVYGAESKYLEERAELEKSMLKLPESETMKLALKSHDADTWDEIDRGWRTLIRVCLLLYSILSKNMAALKEPRKEKSSMGAMFM